MIKRTPVTANIFNAIKTLLAAGANAHECAQYLNVSEATVYRIKSAETIEEYRQMMRAMSAKKTAQQKAKQAQANQEQPKPEQKQVTQVLPDRTMTYYCTNQMMAELKKMNEHLTLLNNKIAYIVEQLA